MSQQNPQVSIEKVLPALTVRIGQDALTIAILNARLDEVTEERDQLASELAGYLSAQAIPTPPEPSLSS